MRRAALILAAAAGMAEGASAQALSCPPGAEAWMRSELYFGLSGPDGPIAEGTFVDFLDAEVTPRFPDGLTLHTVRGRWRSPDGRHVEESARVVVLFHRSAPGASDRLDAIRETYKAAFGQTSVLLVQRPECVSF